MACLDGPVKHMQVLERSISNDFHLMLELEEANHPGLEAEGWAGRDVAVPLLPEAMRAGALSVQPDWSGVEGGANKWLSVSPENEQLHLWAAVLSELAWEMPC